MSHANYSFMLNDQWDISCNGVGQINIATGDYCVAQNVANEIRCFEGDLVFDTEHGIPWFDVQLAKPIIAVLASTYMRDAASQVDGVEQVTAVDVNTANFDHTTRQLSGSIEFTTTTQTPIIVEL